MPGKKVVHKGYSYTQEDLENALSSIKSGMSQRSASKKYGIPKTTLADRISGKLGDCDHSQKISLRIVEKSDYFLR